MHDYDKDIDGYKDCNIDIDTSKECKKMKVLREFEEENKFRQNASADPQTIDMVKYYNQARKDHNFELIESIRRNKEFGNPYILNIVVDHFKIQETGSNYPKEIFDPFEITASDFDNRMKRKRVDSTATIPLTDSAAQASLQPAETVSSATAVSGPSAATLAAAVAAINSSMAARVAATGSSSEAEPRRKSKWG